MFNGVPERGGTGLSKGAATAVCASGTEDAAPGWAGAGNSLCEETGTALSIVAVAQPVMPSKTMPRADEVFEKRRKNVMTATYTTMPIDNCMPILFWR